MRGLSWRGEGGEEKIVVFVPKPLRVNNKTDYYPMKVDRLDHLVLTVKDLDATCRFYAAVLGLEVVTFGEMRKALACDSMRIHLHEAGQEFEPKAHQPTPGCADLCFLVSTSR